MAQGLRVVDEAVPPRAEEVVDDRARQRRLELGRERLGRPVDVALLQLAAVVQTREAFERRCRDPDAAAAAQHPPALAQAVLSLGVRQVLEHVLREHDVEGLVRQREPLAHVEVGEVAAPVVVQVGVEPARQHVLARAEMKLARVVRVEIARDRAPPAHDSEHRFHVLSHPR